MKVGVLAPGGFDPSGTQRVIPALLWLIERLSREAEVHAFAFAGSDRTRRYPLAGATVHAIGAGIRPARAAAAIMREHRRRPFDVLHAFWATRCGSVAVTVGRALRIPTVVHLAGGETADLPLLDYGDLRTRRGRGIVRKVLHAADVVTAPSAPIVAAAAELGVRAVRIPLGVDRRAWPPCPPRERDPSRPARLVHVASLNRVKDPFTLVAAAGSLTRRGTPFVLDIVGEDTLHGLAEATARHHNMNGRVRFHGFREQTKLRPMVLGADVMVMASRHEAGPIAALEAAISGVPVVGTPVGHLAEWAPDAAVVVPPGEPEALADAVEALVSDEQRRLAIANEAHCRALAEDADATARRVIGIYRELTGRT